MQSQVLTSDEYLKEDHIMIKKIAFGLLTASALTMLTALPVMADDEMEVSTGITTSISIEDEEGIFAMPLNETMENIELKTDENGDYFVLESCKKVYFSTAIDAEVDNDNITFSLSGK